MLPLFKQYQRNRLLAKLLTQYTDLVTTKSELVNDDPELLALTIERHDIDLAKLALSYDAVKSTIPGFNLLTAANLAHVIKPQESTGTLFLASKSDADYIYSDLHNIQHYYTRMPVFYEAYRIQVESTISRLLQPAFLAKLQSTEIDIALAALEPIIPELHHSSDEAILALYWLSKHLDGTTLLLPRHLPALVLSTHLELLAKHYNTNLIIRN